MPDEQVTGSIRAHDSATVQLNRLLLREPMHDQELIQRILQRLRYIGKSSKRLLAHVKRCLAEALIHMQSLIRPLTKNRGIEIELKSAFVFVYAPAGSGVVVLSPRRERRAVRPFH